MVKDRWFLPPVLHSLTWLMLPVWDWLDRGDGLQNAKAKPLWLLQAKAGRQNAKMLSQPLAEKQTCQHEIEGMIGL
jgi:hypothetical protein